RSESTSAIRDEGVGTVSVGVALATAMGVRESVLKTGGEDGPSGEIDVGTKGVGPSGETSVGLRGVGPSGTTVMLAVVGGGVGVGGVGVNVGKFCKYVA